MKLQRVLLTATTALSVLLASPAAAQSTAQFAAQSEVPPSVPSTGTGAGVPSGPTEADPNPLVPIPPGLDQEIAAVLENERRAAALEEAKAAAAVEAAAAASVVEAAKSRLTVADQAVAAATTKVQVAQAELDQVMTRLRDAGIQLDQRTLRALDIGVNVYTASGSSRDPRMSVAVAVIAGEDIPDASAAKAYRDVLAGGAFDDLVAANRLVDRIKTAVGPARAGLRRATDDLDRSEAGAESARAELSRAETEQSESVRAGQKLVAEAAVAAPTIKSTELSGGLEIRGDPLVSADDLAQFVRLRGSAHPDVDIDSLAATFISEGRAEGIRADVAWVQSIIETGWFSFKASMVRPGDHNYAGIGACDSCSRGMVFDSDLDGVRTQIQLLRTYATKGLGTDDLANPPPRLAPERSHVRGCCNTWMRLSGVWATGPGYGIKILTLYNQLLAFAASRRSA